VPLAAYKEIVAFDHACVVCVRIAYVLSGEFGGIQNVETERSRKFES
jgi:hypothetical protein